MRTLSLTHDLSSLLEHADAAGDLDRIDWRDPIAAHGGAAVEAMRDWLEAGKHRSFAVRVIGAAAEKGARDQAVAVLQALRPKMPEHIQRDLDAQLKELGVPTVAAAPGIGKPKPIQLDERLYEGLIEAAKQRRLVSYTDAGAPAGLSVRIPHHRRVIGQMLEIVSRREASAGRPMLSSIVVQGGTAYPGKGDREFCARQIEDTFAYWSSRASSSRLAA